MIRTFRVVSAAIFAFGLAAGAQAAPIVSAVSIPFPTIPNMPFGLLNLGSGGSFDLGGAGKTITVPGMTISFTGNSGIYFADNPLPLGARSPMRKADGSPTNRRYLLAQASGPNTSDGLVEIKLDNPTTTFRLLWGSADPLVNPQRPGTHWNWITIVDTGDVITGSQVRALVGLGETGPTRAIRPDLAVTITSTVPFQTLRFEAGLNAFEFLPASVPSPSSALLFGLGGAGLLAAARRRRRA